ncbi:MAG: cell division protein FtsA [Spirochaetota bacterium]|nr:cell division protein FtsA [Spirochaetota bacterium]
MESTIAVGLDIGTTKVSVVVGERDVNGNIEIKGVGTAPSNGLRKGVVVNIDATVDSIRKAIEEAELMAGLTIKDVYVGISGNHIEGMNSRGVIAVSGREREITPAEVERVIDAARAVKIPGARRVLHVLPQEFIVDEQDGIKDAVGMCGVRLEAEIHIITGLTSAIQNMEKSVRRAGLVIRDMVLSPLAASYAVLSDDEKELGCILVDIGGGTTDVLVFVDGAVWHTGVLSLGGNQVTNDLTVGLRTSTVSAEVIKKKYGNALRELVNPAEMVEVPAVGGRMPQRVARTLIAEILQPRMEEIFNLANREIHMTGFDELIAGGVIITGGASLLEGSVELGEGMFKLPVRIGVPRAISGLRDMVSNPLYATAVGLCHCGLEDIEYGELARDSRDGLLKKMSRRAKEWLSEFF